MLNMVFDSNFVRLNVAIIPSEKISDMALSLSKQISQNIAIEFVLDGIGTCNKLLKSFDLGT